MHSAGAINYLQQHYDLQKMRYVGASAGALVATIAACGVSPESAVDCAYRCCQDCSSCHPLGKDTSRPLKPDAGPTASCPCKRDTNLGGGTLCRMATEAKIWDRRLGLLGIWGALIRRWLDEILPPSAHELCTQVSWTLLSTVCHASHSSNSYADVSEACSLCNRGRLELVATDVLKRKQVYISDYPARQEVIDANMCSIHIPVFLDFKPFAYHE